MKLSCFAFLTKAVFSRLVNKLMPKAVKKISESDRPFNQVSHATRQHLAS